MVFLIFLFCRGNASASVHIYCYPDRPLVLTVWTSHSLLPSLISSHFLHFLPAASRWIRVFGYGLSVICAEWEQGFLVASKPADVLSSLKPKSFAAFMNTVSHRGGQRALWQPAAQMFCVCVERLGKCPVLILCQQLRWQACGLVQRKIAKWRGTKKKV